MALGRGEGIWTVRRGLWGQPRAHWYETGMWHLETLVPRLGRTAQVPEREDPLKPLHLGFSGT